MGDIELQSRVEKEEEEMQRRDIENNEQRSLQEESTEKFLSKLEKVVTPAGFVYYVDNSSANHGGDDCLFMSDSDYEGSENQETKLPHEFFGCTHKTSLKVVQLLAPDFSSLVEGGAVDMREIESIHRNFAKFLAHDNHRANLIKEIGTLNDKVLCLIERRGFASSRVEEASFRNVNKVKRKINGSVSPASVNCGPWQSADSQIKRKGEIFRQVDWSYNPVDLNKKRLKLCAVNYPQADTAFQEFETELEITTRAVVDFQNDRSVVHSPKNLNRRVRIQISSRGCEIDFCWKATGVFEVTELSTSKADYGNIPENCTSVVSVVHPGTLQVNREYKCCP